jgi:hypothetical protein
VASQQHAQSIYIRNAGATNSVFLGADQSVTATGGANPGLELPPGAGTPMIQLPPEDAIYGICAAGLTTRVDVLQAFSA